MNQVRNAISAIVATEIPYCATVKSILQGMDSLQIYNSKPGPGPNSLANSGWDRNQTDSVARASNIGLGLYSPVWQGNAKHSFAQTLVHEILHPLLGILGSGNPSDLVEKDLDSKANACVLNHH